VATLSRLFIHPVKSMRGTGLTHALADSSGLAFDRIFMVTEPDGTFITARQFPAMVRFTPALLPMGYTSPPPMAAARWYALRILTRNQHPQKSGATILRPLLRLRPLTSG